MRAFFLSLLLVFSFVFSLSAQSQFYLPVCPIEVTIDKSQLDYLSYFPVDSSEGYLGNIIKRIHKTKTEYKYYDPSGQHVFLKASTRIFSLSHLFTWATEIDLYDTYDQPLGSIEGAIFTFSPAQFKFYDASKQLLAIAYMDVSRMGFTVVSADDQPIAHLRRVFIPQQTDYWTLTIYDDRCLPPEFLMLFGAFAADTQESFRIDD